MKPILAALIVAIGLLSVASGPVTADTPSLPKAKRITIPLIDLDCRPTRKFCVSKESKNATIRFLRCRIKNDASCDLAGEGPIQLLSPDAKILKIAPMPDGCLRLTVRWPLKPDQPPSTGR
jgi:hypothetical protein